MKLFHLADLHLGRRLHECSLLEDQAYILERILDYAKEERPDALLLAGDIYDKTVPSGEAVSLLDSFLVSLRALGCAVLLVAGNHDSEERLAFGNTLFSEAGVYIAPVYDGTVREVVLRDAHGEVAFYLLPYLKAAHVRRFRGDAEIESASDALRAALSGLPRDPARRNILITHATVLGGARGGSEEVLIGGSEEVDAAIFRPFDYTALGHLHRAQSIGDLPIRYSGTPLKYSFSEAHHEKSITMVTLGEKGELMIDTLPLVPRRDLRELRGSYLDIMERGVREGAGREDYLRILLTDEEDIPDGAARLRTVYPNLLRLEYDNRRTRAEADLSFPDEAHALDPLAAFTELYEKQNGTPPDDAALAYLAGIFDRAKEELS